MQNRGGANVQVVQTLSDSDDDNESAWEGRLGDQYKPPGTAPSLEGKGGGRKWVESLVFQYNVGKRGDKLWIVRGKLYLKS